jgi:hypoxanthine phosphoribosyltransferase
MYNPRFRVELISWAEIIRLTARLARLIKADHFKPDIIIAIARGGYIPARLLCDHLDHYNLTSIRITHYLSGAQKTRQARLAEPLHVDIRGLKVLLVDDVDDSGDTLDLALNHLQALQPAEIRIAVLHHKLASTVIPDYYARKITKWRWLTYPWALFEDISSFLKKLEPPATNPEEAVNRLQEESGIQVPLKVMREVFRTTLAND